MRIMPASRNWRHVSIVLLAVAVSAALLFTMLTGADGTRVEAQTEDTPTPAPTATATPDGTEETDASADSGSESEQSGKADGPKYGNMDSILNDLVEQVEGGIASARSAASTAPVSDDESVAVSLFVEEDYLEAVRQYLDENRASVRFAELDTIEAYVPVTLLGNVSQQEGVIIVSTIVPPQPKQGRLVGPGVALHGADAWHNAGLKGEGMKIGVIDVGFRGFQELMGAELPSEENVHALCFNEVGSPTREVSHCEIDSIHGTAVTETVYDVAPNATYYIANPATLGDMRATVDWMISQGVDVVNHSAGWTWSGPGDGTSDFIYSTLNTVDYAAENGILWVNVAGNEGESTWIGAYNDSDGNNMHNFEDENECNPILLEPEERIIGQLRWSGIWFSSRNIDLDLFLVNRDTNEIVARSDNYQRFYPIPRELFLFEAEVKGYYCLEVRKFDGTHPDPAWIHVQAFTSQEIGYSTEGYDIGEPADSANPALLAAGATRWNNLTEVEFFSSRGPTLDGRIKPDIVGVDGTHSLTYGRAFYGTSQSSPYVAGLAALVLQNFPAMGAVEAANYLKSNALDRGEPGPDNSWGHGFAMLPAADASAPEGVINAECHTELGPFENDSSGEVEYTGSWDGTCISEQVADTPRTRGDYNAYYYTFETTADRPVTITLTSSDVNDTFLYVLEDWGTDGDVVDFNDDYEGGDRHSQIVFESLDAGQYTIEATTYSPETTGEFTLTVAMEVAEGYESSGPPDAIGRPVDGYIEVSYGANHACALHSSGSIYCFGDQEGGKTIPPKGKFESVSSGDHGSCAIGRDDGKLVCWGFFSFGE